MKKYSIILFLFFVSGIAFGQGWKEVQKIVASDRQVDDHFGWSCAAYGDYVIVGAYQESSDAGAAYIYEKNSNGVWSQAQKIVASDRSTGDKFGTSVSIYEDYAVVGASFEDEDENGNNTLGSAGSAYIFKRNSNGTWTQVQKIVSNDRESSDLFGVSVSICDRYIVVGAQQEQHDELGLNPFFLTGSAYVFKRNSSDAWVQSQKIVASDRGGQDRFGSQVSIYGNYIAVGAWSESENENGLATMSQSGSVYLFKKNGAGVWSQTQKIVASDRESSGNFGTSISIHKKELIVGAFGESKDENGGGTSMWRAGAVYMFEIDSLGIWTETKKIVAPDRETNNYFGISSSLYGDYAIVGAWSNDYDQYGGNYINGSGSVYILNKDSLGVWAFSQKIVASDREEVDVFGRSVAISEDYAFIGANREDENSFGIDSFSDAGSAYIFRVDDLYRLSGKLYEDLNINCVLDTNEIGLPFYLQANNNLISYDDNGDYILNIFDSTNYYIEPIIPNIYRDLINSYCPNGYAVYLDGNTAKDTSGFDFGFDINQCPLLEIDLKSNRRRRCFQNSTYINYCNNGLADENNVKITVQFPEYVDIISADKAFIKDPEGNYIFDIGLLKIGECGRITIIDSVACESNIVGITQCTKAWISPINQCLNDLDSNSGIWDNSSITLNGNCETDSTMRFKIINVGDLGNGDMDGPSEYRIYVDGTLANTSTFQLQGNEELVIEVPANGQTIRVEADQRPGHPGNSNPNSIIEGCGNGGQPIEFDLVNAQSQDDNDLEMAIDCLPIIDSYDPNDKQVHPSGLTSNKYVHTNSLLDYTVRFQNTGTDTAYRVVVIDTLSSHFDITTFQQGASSHNYSLKIAGTISNPVLIYTFKDINLVDSLTDESNSTGFVSFRISAYDTIANGTVVHNKADIYFDFNDPIITNDAWVTLHDTIFTGASITVKVVTSVEKLLLSELSIYPNPNNGHFTIQGIDNFSNCQLRIVNITGQKQQFNYQYSGGVISVDVSKLLKGMYLLEMIKNDLTIGRVKIIKN